MSWFRAPLRGLLLLALFMAGSMGLKASAIPGLAGGNRSWVVMLIEDHAGMREIVCDGAFTDPQFSGAFLKNHRYAIVTTGSPGLVDLGCWDQAWPNGNGWRAGAPVASLQWTSDRAGFLLNSGGKQTWLPYAADYAGKGAPVATFRGAYLNWLLANRGATPSIPRETRWQRLQRGAEAVVRDLLTRSGGAPKYRIVGLGTSGRLLIPPGEGLQAGLNAVGRMAPSDSGPMKALMDQALETVRSLKSNGNCSPGIVLPVGDGFTLNAACGGGLAYETSTAMGTMVSAAQAILATGQAEVWTWSLDGARIWAMDLAEAGRGQRFSGDAVAALDAAIKAWMARNDQPLQLTLAFDQPALTRIPNVILTLTASHLLASATLNGQPLATTGRETLIPRTLAEGLNTFTVVASDACGEQAQATATITLDTIPPKVTLNPVPPGTTQSPSLLLTGRVDDPAAMLTLNGAALALTTDGGFSIPVNLSIGANAFVFEATDKAGNKGSLSITIQREYPPLALSVAEPLEGATVLGTSVAVSGTLSEAGASLQVNGVPLSVSGTAFAGQAPVEKGENHLIFEASTPDGRTAMVTRTVHKPRGGGGVGGAPIVTITTPMDGFGTNARSLLVQGNVDDPEATLVLYGKAVPLDATGKFETMIASDKEGVIKIPAVATNAYGKGETSVYVHFDWTVPVLTWIAPTPAEGARLTVRQITAAVGVNEPVLASINGQSAPLEPSDDPAAATPYSVQTEIALQEGHLVLRADAVDRAGNRASITRALDIGLTAPQILFDAPIFDGGGSFRTTQAGLTATGSVTAPDAVKPLTLTINGTSVTLDATSRFSWPMAALAAGPNPLSAVATNAFGQSATETRSVVRVQDVNGDGRPTIQIDAPMEDFSTGDSTIQVNGRVNQSGLTVQLQSTVVAVDPATLKFSGQVALSPGPNAILATATATSGTGAGITVTAVVHGMYVISGTSTYRWDLPANGFRTSTRTVSITGRADLPGIAVVSVNGVPMQLSGSGATGQITGDVQLADKGVNALLMDVTTLAGEHFSERRDVIFEPTMPRIRLDAPALAKPGDTVQLKVSPESGTTLASADLSWNGRLLQHLTSPFDAVPAIVPADAAPGARIAVEAIGTDANGESVTARTYVEVRPGGGALLVGAFDDRTGMFLAGGKATLEGGEVKDLDDHGRASFASSQPANWIRVDKTDFASAWRSAALQVGAASAVADARLTLLDAGQSAGASDFDGTFAGGDFKLHVPAANLAGSGKLSLTPLSTQGLPAMLPSGWSPVSAAWLHLEGVSLSGPGTLNLTLPSAAPAQALAWVRWDETQHLWLVLATGLTKDQLTALPMPAPGGYALLTADPDPISPPVPMLNQPLLGSGVPAWREGLKATGAVDPSVMPTVDAIRGLRASAQLSLGFDIANGGIPVPSGALLQVDLTESYVLVDQNLIEPELRSSDAIACRFVLAVDATGKPTLRAAVDGLALELPVRMSRTFGATDLVEGLLRAGFYHDGLQVAIAGDLIGAAGGSTTHDGITLTFDPGTFTSSTFVRVLADAAGDIPALWPELAGKGRVASSFQVDIAGTLQKGLRISIADLGNVPSGIQPLLVANRILEGQRLTLAVGALTLTGGAWTLVIPAEGNALMEGGAFAVIVPNNPWAWVSGIATLPAGVAGILASKVGLQSLVGRNSLSSSASPSSRLKNKKTISLDKRDAGDQEQETSQLQSSTPGPDVAIVDAVITGNLIQAASGPEGRFMLPATLITGKLSITGERYDLGVKGTLDVDVPSSGNTLRLATVPFRVMTILPAENSEVNLGQVFTLLLSAPADPATLDKVKLLKDTTEVSVRRSLSLDGRMLLVTPNAPLSTGTLYALVADGLTGLAGEVAPKITRTVHTTATPPPPNESVDFSRIKLGYPDGSYNVTITIPEGAVPAMASLTLEAPLMGSAYSGQMPPSGDLAITFKANLGERLDITVQFPSGRKVVGNLSRYEAGDGRVTLSVDGGRIDAKDGSGAAVVIPPGALEGPAELTLTFTHELPAELDPALATYKDKVAGRIQLLADHEVTFKLRPRIEIPVPANASLAQHSDGLGAYAVFDKVNGFEEDGTPSVYFVMGDTAAVNGTRLMSQGGLPEPMPMPGGTLRGMAQMTQMAPMGTLAPPVMGKMMTQGMILNREMGPGRGSRIAVKNALAEPMAPSKPMMASVGPQALFGGFSFGALDALMINSGPNYVSGQVMVKVGSDVEKPAVGAYIYFSKDGTIKRTGQMLQLTGSTGYYILASFLTDELVRGGGQIMAIDKDWGVRGFSGTSFGGPGGVFGTYYHVPTIHLEVTASDQSDHIAPWAEIRFEGRDVISSEEARYQGGHEDIYAVVNGYDNRDHENLQVELVLDGVKIESGVMFSRAGGAGKWKVALLNLSPGVHTVEARVKDQAHNQTRLTRTLRVLDIGVEPPVDPNNPPKFNLELDGGLDSARPDAMVKVKFSEPVTGVFNDSLVLEELSGGSWTAVPARWLGSSGPVAVSQRLHTVFIIPNARLEISGHYRVRGTDSIVDFDTPPKKLTQPPVEFKVASYTEIGTFPIPETGIQRVATLGGRTFVAVAKRIYLVRAGGAATAPADPFGVTPEKDFGRQEITEMKVFRQVSVLGSPMDLLVVATDPQPGDSDQQAGLWVFNACNANPVPRLMFGMSLGVGASGYAPTLDCAGGFITVGRLASSIAVVSLDMGVRGWNDTLINQVSTPGGANQQALVQPFYLVNPMESSSNPGVAMLPAAAGSTGGVAIVVGYPGGGARDGKPMRGLPTAILPTDANGVLMVQAPYMPASGVPVEQAGPAEPDKRAYPGPFTGTYGGAASRVSVLPNLDTRLPDGSTLQVSLALGVSLRPSGYGGNSLAIMNEAHPEAAIFVGTWPTAPLGTDAAGNARAYNLPRVSPSIDPITHLVAMPVKFSDTGTFEWFVLDFSQPEAPRTIARVPAAGQYGSFNNGLLAVQAAGGVKLLKIVNGVAGVDEGTCERLIADVGIAMDGNRNGKDEIKFDDSANSRYLFWVNDDYDYTSVKYDDLPYLTRSLVEDDEKEGAEITVGQGMGEHKIPATKNCEDDFINGKRDLEDFTRLHLKVDAHTASLPNLTYWMKFENVTTSGSPSVNIFEAIDGTIHYLNSEPIADQQILKTKLKTIGPSEVQLLNQYIKTGGQASPFILEGKSKGEGDLTLIVRLGGIELGRKSVHLEIRPITEFVEKFKVSTTTDSGDEVHTTAALDPRPNTYTPSDHPEQDDYVLFVHGWNMGEWEKDRWLETVFKRLWWKGYKGRVGGFQWPTKEGFTTYDQSDLRAWRSGQALNGLLTTLNTSHPGRVRVIAHSMGNIVMGEALHRLTTAANPPLVHTYIAAQAAVPAHCYDNSLPTTVSGYTTPNLYGHYFDGKIGNAYFGENVTKVGNLIQYFNSDDFALAGWDFNNKHKPDNASGYFYEDHDGDPDTYNPDPINAFHGDLFYTRSNSILTIPNDQLEIFARCVQSRTRALGTIDLTNYLNLFGIRRDLKEELKFDDKHYSHSREFRSNIAKEWGFWKDVGEDFDLHLPVQ